MWPTCFSPFLFLSPFSFSYLLLPSLSLSHLNRALPELNVLVAILPYQNSEGTETPNPSSSVTQTPTFGRGAVRTKGRDFLAVEWSSPADFDGKLGWLHDKKKLIFTMVSSFFNESD